MVYQLWNDRSKRIGRYSILAIILCILCKYFPFSPLFPSLSLPLFLSLNPFSSKHSSSFSFPNMRPPTFEPIHGRTFEEIGLSSRHAPYIRRLFGLFPYNMPSSACRESGLDRSTGTYVRHDHVDRTTSDHLDAERETVPSRRVAFHGNDDNKGRRRAAETDITTQQNTTSVFTCL